MHDTLGFAAAVTRDNAEYLLEQMRLATAAEVRNEASQREAQMISEHEATLADRTRHFQESALEREAELLRVQSEKDELESEQQRTRAMHATQIESLSAAVSAMQNAARQDVTRRVEKALLFANGTRSRLKVWIVLLYAVCTLAVWLAPSDPLLAGIATVALAVVGFWVVPQLVFDKLLTANWRIDFERECIRLLVDASLKEFDVDAASGVVARRDVAKNDQSIDASKPV